MRFRSSTSAPVWVLGLILLLAACDEPASADAPQSAPPDVGIVTVKAEPFALMRELPGRVAPTRVADVRPRVSGIVVQRLFEQGSDVKAAIRSIRSIPSRSRSSCRRAKPAWSGRRRPRPRPAAGQSHRRPGEAQAIATAAARDCRGHRGAEQGRARRPRGRGGARRLNLDYATIRAPIGGRIGAARATEGARSCRTTPPISPPSSSSTRSMPTSPSRSPS